MKKILVLFILTSFASVLAYAQPEQVTVEIFEVHYDDLLSFESAENTVVHVPGTGSGTDVTTIGNTLYKIDCNDWGFFSDRAGKHKPYENNRDYYTTLCSNSGSKGVSVDFQQFSLEKTDKLTVWDESRTSPVTSTDLPSSDDEIGVYTGNSSPGTGKLTSKKGCLTFRFVSDGSVVRTGWYGKIGCSNKPVVDPCIRFNSRIDSEIMCGMKVKDDNYRGKNNYESYGDCTMKGWESNGRELIYKFVNQKASDLTFTLKEMNGSQPKVLNMHILDDCKASACVGAITRPAANGKQDVESVTIKDAKAGTYYIVVDGNQKYSHNWFELSVECTGGSAMLCTDPTYYEDFESYSTGSAITKANNHWYKSSNVGVRDAEVSADRASNGSNALEFNRRDEGTQDVFLHLGREFKGKYRVCWDMYINPMSTAFFGLFGGDNSDPWGSVSKEFGMNNGMEGRWFNIELFVDLDNNKYALYMDNRKQVTTGDYFLNLDALNFYGLPGAHFYVDNLCYAAVSRIPATSSSRIVAESDSPLFNADKQFAVASNVAITNSDDAQGTFSLATSKLNADDLKVMPNPTTGRTLIALDLAQEQSVNLQIFSPAGQLVRHIPLGKTNTIRQEVNLSNLSNGLYILRATGEQSVITKKIILQK